MSFPQSPITLTIPGLPISQGSKNAYRTKSGRTILVETRANELAQYRARVALVAANLRRPEYDCPLALYVEFVLPRPARPKFDMPAVAPDLDKFQRAIFDALTEAGVWKDDARAVKVTALKRYARRDESPHTRLVLGQHKETQ